MFSLKLSKRPVRTHHHFYIPFVTFMFVLALVAGVQTLHAAQVKLAWDANTDAVAGYKLYRGSASRSYTSNVDVGNTTSYTWTGLTEPQTYYFAATAYDSAGNESSYSEELVCHTISVSGGTGGTISPSSTVFVASGGSQTLTITPSTGYTVSSVLVDGVSVGAVTSYTFSSVTSPHTISAVFAAIPITYTITSSVTGSGGVISPSGSTTVSSGGSQTYTITPNSGYKVNSVLVNGSSVGAVTSYTFSNVTSNQTIAASFAPITYTITSSVTGSGGSISPSGSTTVSSGGSQTYTITPNSGYKVNSVLVNGSSVGAVTSYTFSNVTSNQTIAASFAPITYTITSSVTGSGGSISPSGSTTVSSGGSQTYTITPNSGYKVNSVLVNGSSVGAVTSYTLSNVTSNQTIAASFAPITYTITSSVTGSGGVISPSGSTTVSSGGSQTYTITPDADYQIDTLMVDGSPVSPSGTTYTFSSVADNHTISVSFKTSNKAPVAEAGPDQTVSEGVLVTLTGSNSTDAENDIVSYLWEQIEGPQVQLSSTTVADPTFTAPDVGPEGLALTFRLTVTDGLQASASDTCIVNVSWVNIPPVAKAGPDQTVGEWATVTLDGSSSTDSDDGVESYSWKQTSGPSVEIVDPNQPVVSFVAPDVASGGAALGFELTVTDYNGLKATDTCIVNVTWVNTPPVSDAGPDQRVFEGDTVVLNGSGSSDSDDGIVSYRWRQVQGTSVTLSDPTAPVLDFTAPVTSQTTEALVFSLVVTDAGGLQSEDTCVVSVSKKAGIDLSGSWGSSSYNGLTFTGTLKLKNDGTVTAGNFKVSFYSSRDGITRSRLIKSVTIKGLAAGATKNWVFSYTNSTLAGQYMIAVVDSSQVIAELNETNNSTSVSINR